MMLKECIEYFKHPGFKRFNQAWIKKYQSLGHLGGQITLFNLSSLEKETIGAFLGTDLSNGTLKISYRKFNQLLQETKFEGIDYLDVLNHLDNKPIITNKEIKSKKILLIENFKEYFLTKYSQDHCYPWLLAYLNNDVQVNRYIYKNKNEFLKKLDKIAMALNNLPVYQNQYLLLPVFSQRITGDPHFFDQDFHKKLLIDGITVLLKTDKQKLTLHNINDILFQAGLLKDDLSNNCYICHLKPDTASNWEGFYQNYEPWNMNLYNLMQVKQKFKAMNVYIVENPSVFRVLVNYIKDKQLDVGLICSNGQINLCTYMLLDYLSQSGCILYYAGDFDPEGLLISDKLKQRYLDTLNLWGYSKENFYQILSKQQHLFSKRMKKLYNLQTPVLKDIADLIIKNAAFGYQEGLISFYKKTIR
ncbi:TIGR02679 domain-containing protein [Thomasclavelia spiroformis]|uniref:TIGR02679 domain-containing protein n=1 Tax=Thomasclavelia spiroformis TaxID=29348 RepID=UPI0039950F0A